MALSVNTLVDYVIENENELVAKSLFSGKTSQLISSEGTVLTGVKFAQKINILATDAIFQNGAGCTRVPSGTTSLTQRQVTIGEIAVVEDICVKTLNSKYMSKKLAAGSDVNTLPFEQEFADLKSATIGKQLEIAIWQGDTASGNTNLNKFDGLIKLIDAAGTAVNGNTTGITTGTGVTVANIKTVVDNTWLALPADVTGQDDIRVFIGWDNFNKFIASFKDQNLFNFAPTGSEVSAANGVVIIPGTNYRLTAVHGLNGTNRLFAMRTSNMFAGVDLENEYEQFSMMEDQFKDYLRFKAQFKYGVNVAFPDEIVSFKLV
jgi:hypothetical protein